MTKLPIITKIMILMVTMIKTTIISNDLQDSKYALNFNILTFYYAMNPSVSL